MRQTESAPVRDALIADRYRDYFFGLDFPTGLAAFRNLAFDLSQLLRCRLLARTDLQSPELVEGQAHLWPSGLEWDPEGLPPLRGHGC